MKPLERASRPSRAAKLTRARMILALAVAVVADGTQWLLGPLGWVFSDQLIDLAVMLLVSGLMGFHWLLLPSFVLELVPLVDEFPTWTACVMAVIIMRRREQRLRPPLSPEKPTIEI